MVLAVLPNGPLQRQGVRRNVDVLCAMPCLAVVLGLVAACFGFQDQSAAVALLRDYGGAALILAAVADVLLACAAVAYCLCVNLGKDAEGRRRRACLLYTSNSAGVAGYYAGAVTVLFGLSIVIGFLGYFNAFVVLAVAALVTMAFMLAAVATSPMRGMKGKE